MIYIPFIFFLLLALFVIKERGIDASAYILLLYSVSSFCSILLYQQGVPELYKESCTFFPTMIYCGLISLAVFPIYKFNTGNLQKIIMPNTTAIKWLTYLYFVIFVTFLVAYWQDIVFILTFDNFAELRADVMDGRTFITRYSGLLGLVMLVFNTMATTSFIMLPVFFINVLSNQKRRCQIMALLGSTPMIILGILGVDRSKSFYWVVLLGLSLVIFWKYLSKKSKKIVSVLSILLLSGLLVYFSSVTMDRFEDTDLGVGVLSYAGQSYINFCYFFENFNNGETFSTRYLLPATHFWLLKDYKGAVHLQQELSRLTGIEAGVFYSFLGNFIVDNNQIGPFVYMFIYILLCAIYLQKRHSNRISILRFMYFFCLSVVPTCGVISYVYTSPYMTISIMFVMMLIALTYLQRR